MVADGLVVCQHGPHRELARLSLKSPHDQEGILLAGLRRQPFPVREFGEL